jgi:hypothetical protein
MFLRLFRTLQYCLTLIAVEIMQKHVMSCPTHISSVNLKRFRIIKGSELAGINNGLSEHPLVLAKYLVADNYTKLQIARIGNSARTCI